MLVTSAGRFESISQQIDINLLDCLLSPVLSLFNEEKKVISSRQNFMKGELQPSDSFINI